MLITKKKFEDLRRYLRKKEKPKARFISTKQQKIERFKYKFLHLVSLTRRNKNIFKDFIIKNVRLVDWKSISKEGIVWILEAGIEGIPINYALHILKGYELNFYTVFAYGAVFKYFLYYLSKLIKNGDYRKIPQQKLLNK